MIAGKNTGWKPQVHFPTHKLTASNPMFSLEHIWSPWEYKQWLYRFPSPFTEMTRWKTLLWNAISQRPQQWLISLCCNTEVKVELFDSTTEVFQWHKREILHLQKAVCHHQGFLNLHIKTSLSMFQRTRKCWKGSWERFEWIKEFKLQCIL